MGHRRTLLQEGTAAAGEVRARPRPGHHHHVRRGRPPRPRALRDRPPAPGCGVRGVGVASLRGQAERDGRRRGDRGHSRGALRRLRVRLQGGDGGDVRRALPRPLRRRRDRAGHRGRHLPGRPRGRARVLGLGGGGGLRPGPRGPGRGLRAHLRVHDRHPGLLEARVPALPAPRRALHRRACVLQARPLLCTRDHGEKRHLARRLPLGRLPPAQREVPPAGGEGAGLPEGEGGSGSPVSGDRQHLLGLVTHGSHRGARRGRARRPHPHGELRLRGGQRRLHLARRGADPRGPGPRTRRPAIRSRTTLAISTTGRTPSSAARSSAPPSRTERTPCAMWP